MAKFIRIFNHIWKLLLLLLIICLVWSVIPCTFDGILLKGGVDISEFYKRGWYWETDWELESRLINKKYPNVRIDLDYAPMSDNSVYSVQESVIKDGVWSFTVEKSVGKSPDMFMLSGFRLVPVGYVWNFGGKCNYRMYNVSFSYIFDKLLHRAENIAETI